LIRIDETFICALHFDGPEPDANAVADFRTEVLDQALRERIRKETEGVRNLILAKAFSEAPLDSDGELR